MLSKTGTLLACLSILALAPSVAAAKDGNSQESFQVSSLRLSSLPIPTSREKVLGESAPAKAAKIRRTATGIRMVGPVFFPEDRQ
ncbi:hypothetical protein [Jiella sonneratiae]|uniref:Uncharacterized protein n=1 Tax=Jiella sonneratiae TaxID=2816856 RepID=A0ABS3J696_9HYPH|nr:hypothetical protein [Jiella sonneratiae]MBO0904478.1 hypothetical protein [Jiella sonneratiae]